MMIQSQALNTDSLFSRIFHASPVAIWITDIETGLCIDVNDAYATLVGRAREELIGCSACDLSLDVLTPVGAPLGSSRSTGQADRFFKLDLADGTTRQVIVSSQNEIWDGRPVRISLIQDMGKFKRTQDALQHSEARLRLFFESMPLPIFVFDKETLKILNTNQKAAEHYGYSREELLSMSMVDIRPQDAVDDFLETLNGLADETQHVGIKKHRKKDGTNFFVDVTSYALEIDGRPARLGVMQDVTEKGAIENSLREREERLKVIAEITTDVIWQFDIASRMVSYTSGLETMYGHKGCEYTSIDWWTQHIHPEDREATMASFDGAIEGDDTVWEAQYRFRRSDGRYAYVLDRGYILRDPDGQATSMIGAMVDITRRVELQEAANKAISMERQRLARDLHDAVTQSLYSLSLMAEAARRRANLGDKKAATEYIVRLGELAQQSLKEMHLLVYESKSPALEKDGLRGALEDRLDAVERRAGIQARLRVALDQELPSEVQVQFFRVAEEALNNALKHARATEVEVTVSKVNGSAVLEITDNGVGFDPADVASTAGLGLISMRERLEKLGGRFELNTELGKGTTIRVTLDKRDNNHGQLDPDIDM